MKVGRHMDYKFSAIRFTWFYSLIIATCNVSVNCIFKVIFELVITNINKQLLHYILFYNIRRVRFVCDV